MSLFVTAFLKKINTCGFFTHFDHHTASQIVANPFKDMAELMMMDASMGGSSNSNSTQALGAACEKTIATLQRILPLCRADMPVLQAQLVATLARRITEVIYNRDRAELALFA